jgi:hypothetical protein
MNPESEFSWKSAVPSPERQFSRVLEDIRALKSRMDRLPPTSQGQAVKLMIEAVCIVLEEGAAPSKSDSERPYLGEVQRILSDVNKTLGL